MMKTALIRRRARMLPALAIFAAAMIACRDGGHRGGDDDASAASAVAARFLSALGAERWDSAAALIDSAEVRQFRDRQLALLAGIAEHQRDITRAMSATGSGGMASVGTGVPLDTAMLARHRGWPVRSLAGEPTLGELAALPARSFYARMYPSLTHCLWLPSMDGLRIVGTVIDHDSAAYVVYQRSVKATDAPGATQTNAILELARHGRRWDVRPGRLEPEVDVIALLDTSVAGRAMLAEACHHGNQPSEPPAR